MSFSQSDGGEQAGGHTYAGVLVRLTPAEGEVAPDDAPVLAALAAARFSGFVGPVERPVDAPWLVAVADEPTGAVAGGRTGLGVLVRRLAGELGTLVLGAEVERDRALRLVWAGPDGSGEYDSDPSFGAEEDDDAWAEPVGVELLAELAAAAGRPETADDLVELLGEEIDTDSTYESERLRAALRLLGAPAWLVASDSLPRDVPGGPRRGEVRRLGAGRTGASGRAAGALVGVIRRRRRPRED